MSATNVTLTGNVVDEVKVKPTVTGLSRVSFRVVSTERRRDPETKEWVDGHKLFVSVTFWREFAENVALSVKKGDPIVITGRLYSRQYIKDENSRVSYELEPESIGHDLARGVSKFERRKRGFSGTVEVDEDGFPVGAEDDGYVLMPDDEAAVREMAGAALVAS